MPTNYIFLICFPAIAARRTRTIIINRCWLRLERLLQSSNLKPDGVVACVKIPVYLTADDVAFAFNDLSVDVIVCFEHVLFAFALKTVEKLLNTDVCTIHAHAHAHAHDAHEFNSRWLILSF